MRANHDARLSRREAARRREESPEEREARWQSARDGARDQMRQERRAERIAAGIETMPTITLDLRIDTETLQRLNGSIGAAAKAYMDAIRPGLEAFAHACMEIQKTSVTPEQRDALAQVVADTKCTAPKPPPPRERYLPGTRHARKGQRR